MGDREIPQFNRIIFAKWGNRTQQLHQQRLRSEVRSVIDTHSPPSFAHLTQRRKLKQKWADEQSRIEYENMLLLNRMRTIMSEQQNKQFLDAHVPGSQQGGIGSILLNSAPDGTIKGSLNRGERIREMKRILHENEALLARIQARGPTYNVAEWEADHLRKEKHLSGMGRYPYVSSSLPLEDAKPRGPLKRYGTLRFPVDRQFASTGSLPTMSQSYSASSLPPPFYATSQPLTPHSASLKSLAPDRIHHLPPRAMTEEKQDRGYKKRMVVSATDGKKKKQVPPVEFSIQVEQLSGLLPNEEDVPRVFVYVRSSSGEYVPHNEVSLSPVDLPSGPGWYGLSVVSGLASVEDDKRIRLAIFSPNDPTFQTSTGSESTLLVPQDNTHLIGEARFSLSHFTQFQRQYYKLKVLRHGLPIAGPNFAVEGANIPYIASMGADEIDRRRSLPEAILVLQHTNKYIPDLDPSSVDSSVKSLAHDLNEASQAQAQADAEVVAAASAAAAAQAEADRLEAERNEAERLERERQEAEAAEKAEATKRREAARQRKREEAARKKEAEEREAEERRKAAEEQAALEAAEAQSKKEAARAAKAEAKRLEEERRAAEAAAAEAEAKAEADRIEAERIEAARVEEEKKARAASAKRKKQQEELNAKLRAMDEILSSEAGCKILPNGRSSTLSNDLLTGGIDADTLRPYVDAAADADLTHTADELLDAILAGLATQLESRRRIRDALAPSKLLPIGVTEQDIDELGREADMPLVPIQTICHTHAEALLAALTAIDAQGLKFQQVPHLATAVKKQRAKQQQQQQQQQMQQRHQQSETIVKTAADVLADIQATRAAQEAEVARVMAERGLTEPEEEVEEFSKPYVEDEVQPTIATASPPIEDEFPSYEEEATNVEPLAPSPSPAEIDAAIRIQALQRGHAVRAHKAEILAEKKAAKEAAQTKKEEENQRKREEEEAKKKATQEVEQRSKKEEEARAKELEAAKAADESKRVLEAEDRLRTKLFTVTLYVACKNIPSHSTSPTVVPSPIVALYSKDPSTGSFTSTSQTERIQSSASPTFAQPLTLTRVGSSEEEQFMFSVYNVANAAEIGENDLTGTALAHHADLFKQIARSAAGLPFQSMQFPITQNGVILEGAFVTIVNLTYEEESSPPPPTTAPVTSEPTSPASVTRAESMPRQIQIWVKIKNILLPEGTTKCNSLAALYTKSHDSSNFNYLSQTDCVPGLSPSFDTTPLLIDRPANGGDTDCMLNVYNHLADVDGESSEPVALGASLFSLNKLINSSGGAIAASLVRSGQVVGQVVLKTRHDAQSVAVSRNVSRPNSAVRGSSASKKKRAQSPMDIYDLTISCANLPVDSPDAKCDPMVALYGEDPSTQQFGYIGQTEQSTGRNPTFHSKIRLDDHTGGGNEGDRSLMLMIYNVRDEANIQPTDQIGTCALTWKFLKDQSSSPNRSITLPLLSTTGEQHPEATITIKIDPISQ